MDGRVLIYTWTGAYICMYGCLYMHGRVLIYAWTVAYIYAWTGAYICMDGCLYCMDGCLAVIYRVSARYRLIHAKLNGPDSFADGLPLHISNDNRIIAVNSAPTGPCCTRTGIVYTLIFSSVTQLLNWWFRQILVMKVAKAILLFVICKPDETYIILLFQ